MKVADLSGFHRDITDLLVTLVNDHGVRVRQPDGRHVLLYNGQRGTPPLKVSAARPVTSSRKYLTAWAESNVKGWRGAR